MKQKKLTEYLLFIMIYTLAFYFWIYFVNVPEKMHALGTNIFLTLSILISLIWMTDGLRQPKKRPFLLFIFLGTTSYLIAELIRLFYQNILHQDVPLFSSVTFFYLVYLLFFVAGFFLILFKQKIRYFVYKFLLDTAIIMTVLFTFIIYFLILPSMENATLAEPVLKYLAIGYPLGCISLIFGALILARLCNNELPIKFIIIGLLFLAASDLFFAYFQLTRSTYFESTDPLSSLGFLFLGLSGALLKPEHPIVWTKKDGYHDSRLIHPLLLPIASVSILLFFVFNNERHNVVLESGLVTSVLLIFVRQIHVLLENKVLIREYQNKTENLEKSEQRYRSLFEFNSNAVLSVDLNGKITSANHASGALLGYRKEELIGRSVFSVLNYEESETLKQSFKYAKMDITQKFEFPVKRRNGQTRYVILTITPIKVQNNITGLYILGDDITQRHLDKEKITRMAFHDALTDLPNRRKFENELENVVIESEKNGITFGILFIDLDRFKMVNDTLNHRLGDQLLITVASRLAAFQCDKTLVARFGGDEFTILVKESSELEIERLAQNIITSLNKPYEIVGREIFINVSIGIAMYPDGGETVEDLLKNADLAMYRAKGHSNSNYFFFNKDRNSEITRMLQLEQDLYSVIDKNQLQVFYQPQIDYQTGKMIGVEALIRWQHPKFGFVSPGEFIPIAENNGIISEISDWVLYEACKQVKEWNDLGFHLRLGVNLSPKQFYTGNLVEKVQDVLNRTGLQPEMLDLEITEGIAMDESDVVFQILEDLQKIGVTISVDDFGTGYSSLSYLANYPINTLKIAREFIDKIGKDKGQEAIISSIVSLAQNLNLSIIAEGVETQEQALHLLKLDCNQMQGFLFGKPMPAERMEEQLKDTIHIISV